ncbi:hypothetical protein NFI95_10155 [Acetobacteraceae bacterium KSS8]|uniref:DUF2993 domain-containing protein n=1 Tax=Endosaccharibacter trunci TaxID=2812733 RepID=A0ABT1W7F3_9PROT|nr:hypothetical protein [Acetobacteraceae bacterium KSS8]
MTHPGNSATRPVSPALPMPLCGRLGLVLGAALFLGSGTALAASPLDLPGGCVVARGAVHGNDTRLEADKLEISLPADQAAAFHASHLSAVTRNATLPPGALGHASTAAAAALLGALTGHRDADCSDQAFKEAIAPVAQAVAHGGHVSFAWTGVSLRSGTRRMGAARIALQLDGGGDTARLALQVAGAASNDSAAPLLPERLELNASLPASELPALVAAAGGRGAPVDLTIDRIHAVRGDTTLTGNGQARIAADPADNSGTAHVAIAGYDSLLDAAGTAGLQKIRTALFLAKLMAHRNGGDADWDLKWQGSTLLVNNVPLPIR